MHYNDCPTNGITIKSGDISHRAYLIVKTEYFTIKKKKIHNFDYQFICC